MLKLDRFDRQLLNLVQENTGLTAEQMSERVPLSPSAIQRRLRHLREQGIILRDVSVIDPHKIGRPTHFVVSVQVERENPERSAQFRTWLAEQPHVQQVFYVTGDVDYILIVTAPDTETYDLLMARMVGENPNVKRYTTHVALSVVKRGLVVPLLLERDN